MQSPKTIDIIASNVLFEDADPIGLLPEQSASRYLDALRERLAEAFPKARVFIKWIPSRKEPPDIVTLPKVEEAEERVLEIAEELRQDRQEWVQHDESIRAAFA